MLRKLEKHNTKNKITKKINGELIPLFRDWDHAQKNPKMIYITICEPFEKKGEHLHVFREDNFTCVKGKVVFIVKKNNKYEEYFLTEENPQTLKIPENVPSAHINIGIEKAIVINCASTSWHPDNPDDNFVKFENYDWKKWKKICNNELEKNINMQKLSQNKIIFLREQLKLMKDWAG